jgi:hypothetical protein
MHPQEPPAPPSPALSPAATASALARALTAQAMTSLYAAADTRLAVVSVTAALTAWTDGRQIWCTHGGQRRTWPATDPHAAALALAALTRLAAGS